MTDVDSDGFQDALVVSKVCYVQGNVSDRSNRFLEVRLRAWR